MTRILFVEWLTEVFAPAVKKYLEENDLPLKCLVVMDNAPAHHPGLEDDLDTTYDFISVKFFATQHNTSTAAKGPASDCQLQIVIHQGSLCKVFSSDQ